jgi:hypothetical protein
MDTPVTGWVLDQEATMHGRERRSYPATMTSDLTFVQNVHLTKQPRRLQRRQGSRN